MNLMSTFESPSHRGVTIQPARSSNSRSGNRSDLIRLIFALSRANEPMLACPRTDQGLWCLIRGHRSHWHFCHPLQSLESQFIHQLLHPSFKAVFELLGQSVQIPVGTCLHSVSRWLEPETSITKRVCSPHTIPCPPNLHLQPSPIESQSISDNRCKRVRSTRGSSIVANTFVGAGSEQFAAATDESVGAEQNQQILGHESSRGQRVLFDHPSDSQ